MATLLDPKKRESFERLQQLIDRIKPNWLKQPNIVDLRPVIKVCKGVARPETLVIGFYVTDKVAPNLLGDRGYAQIPDEIENVGTDVVLIRQKPHGSVDEKATRSAMFDTLVGGCAIGNSNMPYYGTFAMPLLAASDGRLVGLTNEHVLVFDGEGHAGDDVWQPRFHLNAEVSLDSADCCPNGQLHYRSVDNPIIDAAMATAAGCAIAAAASDTIDPHRRGQVATIPNPGERTLKETVSAEVQYPEIPLPGRPFKVAIKWKYERQTDTRVMQHAVSETQINGHVLSGQHLTTDQAKYPPGANVIFTAFLGTEPDKSDCGNYFVTAAALSPSHQRAYKLILRPTDVTASAAARAGSQMQTNRRCFGFPREYYHKPLRKPTALNGIVYDPAGQTMEVVLENGIFALHFPDTGVTATLPFPVQEVLTRVRTGDFAVTLKAYDGITEVGSAVAASAASPVQLQIAAPRITSLTFTGGGSASAIEEICVVWRVPHLCEYRGTLALAHDEELGEWTTYLFAQTRNDVALGTEPTVAARTIGGLPVTDNFLDAGATDSFIYGHRCNVELKPDGNFEVVAPGTVLQ
jgi:hypothetical protein